MCIYTCLYVDMYVYTQFNLSNSLILIQPLKIQLCCAAVTLCVKLCTENTMKTTK